MRSASSIFVTTTVGGGSLSLDPAHLCTTTTIAVSPSFDQDRMWLNGKEISLAGGRFQSCLKEIRSRACDVEDEEKGIKIAKKDWENLHLHIASYNNFPTAAGLASSAAGFACLVILSTRPGYYGILDGVRKKVAASCLWLASKLEEGPRKARQVLIVFHRIECRMENLLIEHLEIGSQKYHDLKADLSGTERHILKEMGFVCHVEHPHKFISYYLAILKTPPELRQEAWNLAYDRFLIGGF